MHGAPAEPESSDPPAPTYTKSYTYDLAGNRTGFTLTQGSETIQELTYTYDTLNRLSSVCMDNVTQARYTYDTNGNRASLTYPNGDAESSFCGPKNGTKEPSPDEEFFNAGGYQWLKDTRSLYGCIVVNYQL